MLVDSVSNWAASSVVTSASQRRPLPWRGWRLPALPELFELLPGAGTCSIRPAPPFWAFFGADCAPACWPPPEVAAALLPADAGAAEVADGAEAALLEPAECALLALPDAAGSAESAEDWSGAGAGLDS